MFNQVFENMKKLYINFLFDVLIVKDKRNIVKIIPKEEAIMKMFSLLGSVLLFLGLSLFIGCGGGSSGGTSANALTTESVNNFVRGISNKLGCEYTEGAFVNPDVGLDDPLPDGGGSVFPAAMRNLLGNIVDADGKLNQDVSSNLRTLRETENIVGDCGGSIIITANEATGDATYVFDDYCNGELTGERSVINGALSLKMTQSDVLLVIRASTTQALNIVTTNPETDENVDVSIELSDAVLTVKGTLSLSDLSSLDVKLTVASGSIADNSTGLVYSGRNLLLTFVNGVAEFSATFTDPELGVVTVSGTADENQEFTINMVGAGGGNAIFTTTSQEAVFAVTTNNEPAGTMDCSMIYTSLLEEL